MNAKTPRTPRQREKKRSQGSGADEDLEVFTFPALFFLGVPTLAFLAPWRSFIFGLQQGTHMIND
jgi:hypothetical protein